MPSVEQEVLESFKDGLRTISQYGTRAAFNVSNTILNILRMQAQKAIEKGKIPSNGMTNLDLLQKAVNKGEQLKQFIIGDEDYLLFLKEANRLDVLYAVSDVYGDDSKVVWYLERDDEKMEKCVELLNVRSGLLNEVDANLFIHDLSNEEIAVFDHLSDVEIELFKHHMKEQNMMYSTVFDGKEHMILVNQEDRNKASYILGLISWDLVGGQGEKIVQQVKERLQTRDSIRKAVQQDTRDEVYIVNGDNFNNYLHIKDDAYTFYKNGVALKTVQRSSAQYASSIQERLQSLSTPVLFTKEEYETLSKEQKQEKMRQKMELYPTNYEMEMQHQNFRRWCQIVKDAIHKDEAVKEKMDQVNETMKHRTMKLALDNEGNSLDAVMDDSITYEMFAGYEALFDDDEEKARKLEFERLKKSLQYEEKFACSSYKLQTKTLDQLITEVETTRGNEDVKETTVREYQEREKKHNEKA